MAHSLSQAISLIKTGQVKAARASLEPLLSQDPHNESAWLWYIETLPTVPEKLKALEECLGHNPECQLAQQGLAHFSQLKESPPPVYTAPFTADKIQLTAAPVHAVRPSPGKPAKVAPFTVNPAPLPAHQNQKKGHPAQRKGRSPFLIAAVGLLAALAICGLSAGTVWLVTLQSPQLAQPILATSALAAPLPVGMSNPSSPLPTPLPAPTQTPFPKIVISPTKTNCDCTDSKVYIERTLRRLKEMENDATIVNSAIKGKTIDQNAFISLSGFAKVRYADQVAEQPPVCLRNFQIKIVGYFSNWYRGMESVKNGEYRNSAVYMQSLLEKQAEMLAEAESVTDKFNHCIPGESGPQV